MATVLLVMKRPGNIRVISNVLEAIGHDVLSVSNLESLQTTLAQAEGDCIGVVDASDFGAAGGHIGQAFQQHGIRFVVLCAAHEIGRGGKMVSHGAVGFLQKPIRKPHFLQMLSGLLGEAPAQALTQGA